MEESFKNETLRLTLFLGHYSLAPSCLKHGGQELGYPTLKQGWYESILFNQMKENKLNVTSSTSWLE